MPSNEKLSFAAENKEKTEALKNKIFSAFGNTEPPSRDRIALHDCEQCRQLREDFAGVKWQEAGGELLERNYDKIPLFAPQAFNYFLPSFLIYTLKNFDSSTEVGEFTVYALSPGKKWNEDASGFDYWAARFAPFTDEQMETVFDFFDLVRENPVYEYEFNSVGKKIFDRLKTIRSAG